MGTRTLSSTCARRACHVARDRIFSNTAKRLKSFLLAQVCSAVRPKAAARQLPRPHRTHMHFAVVVRGSVELNKTRKRCHKKPHQLITNARTRFHSKAPLHRVDAPSASEQASPQTFVTGQGFTQADGVNGSCPLHVWLGVATSELRVRDRRYLLRAVSYGILEHDLVYYNCLASMCTTWLVAQCMSFDAPSNGSTVAGGRCSLPHPSRGFTA